jgi:hypothetical protein
MCCVNDSYRFLVLPLWPWSRPSSLRRSVLVGLHSLAHFLIPHFLILQNPPLRCGRVRFRSILIRNLMIHCIDAGPLRHRHRHLVTHLRRTKPRFFCSVHIVHDPYSLAICRSHFICDLPPVIANAPNWRLHSLMGQPNTLDIIIKSNIDTCTVMQCSSPFHFFFLFHVFFFFLTNCNDKI